MRHARLKITDRAACYHVLSRTVDGDRLFHEEAKGVFQKQLRQVAAFCGIEVLTHAVMNNHFHLLIRVPEPRDVPEGEVLRRAGILYGEDHAEALALDLKSEEEWRRKQATVLVEAYRRRMGDLSVFLRELKQRFSIWYNHQHDRYGALWAERFKSLLVEADAAVLLRVAAYIDLNGARARQAPEEEPEAYAWCGWGQAHRGEEEALLGLCRLLGVADAEKALARYALVLRGRGGPRARVKRRGNAAQAQGLPTSPGGEVSEGGGDHSGQSEPGLRRQRWLIQGAVLGSASFVRQAAALFEGKLQTARVRKGPFGAPGGPGTGWSVLKRPRREPKHVAASCVLKFSDSSM